MKKTFAALFMLIGVYDLGHGTYSLINGKSNAFVLLSFGVLCLGIGLILYLSGRKKKQ